MWKIIKGFVKLWIVLFLILLFISCFLYRNQIADIMKNNLWTALNGLIPILLVIGAIFYAILNALRK